MAEISTTRGVANVLSALALVALSSCGAEPRPTERPGPPRPRWIPQSDAVVAAREEGDLSRREWGVLELPQAGAPGFDAPTSVHPHKCRLVVNLEASGTTYFHGQNWPGTPEGFAHLAEAMARRIRECGDLTAPDRLRVLVRIDRTRPWAYCGELLAACPAGADGIRRCRLGLQSRDPGLSNGRDAALDANIGPAEVEPFPGLPTLRLDDRGQGVEASLSYRMDRSSQSWSFGPLDLLTDDPAALAAANIAWDGIDDALVAFAPTSRGRIRFEIASTVPWAYVAQAMGLCHEHGRDELSSVDLGEVQLISPPKHRFVDPGRDVRDTPISRTLWIGLGIALAAALVFLGTRRGCPSRRTPTSKAPAP